MIVVLARIEEIERAVTAATATGSPALAAKAQMAEALRAIARCPPPTADRDVMASLVRDLDAAAVAAAPPPPTPALVAPADDAALFALAERRQVLDGAANARPPGLTDDESEARVAKLSDEMVELEDEMAERPAVTIAGVALKLRVAFSIMEPSDCYCSGRLELSVMADLDRLVGGTP